MEKYAELKNDTELLREIFGRLCIVRIVLGLIISLSDMRALSLFQLFEIDVYISIYIYD